MSDKLAAALDAADAKVNPTPTETPSPAPTPSAAPAVATPPRDEKGRFTAQETTAPAEQTPAPAAPETPASRKVKYQFNHAEEELDVDETIKALNAWAADPSKPPSVVETFQKGRAFDRSLERKEREAQEAVQKAYADWFNDQGYQVVQDPHAPRGWRLIPKQATTPEKDADPLAIEEQTLLPKAKEGDIEAILRLQEVRADRAAKRERQAFEKEQARAAQEARQRQEYERGMSWLNTEVDKAIEARAKSFEGPDADRRKARLRTLAVSQFFQQVTPEEQSRGITALAKALAVVNDEANDLDARQEHWKKTLVATAKPTPPPVIGATPAGVGAPAKPNLRTKEGWDAAFDQIEQRLASKS